MMRMLNSVPHQPRCEILATQFWTRRLLPLIMSLAVLLGLFFVLIPDSHSAVPKNVLVINAYHQGYRWSDQVITGIRDTLLAAAPQTQMYVENLDSKRFHSPAAFNRLADLIREKYRQTAFDAVIAADNNSISFLRQHRHSLFAGIPAVFCGANDLNPAELDGMGPITGVNEAADVRDTIELALQLRPSTRRMVVVNDTTPTGRNVDREIKRMASAFTDRLTFVYWDDLGREDLIRQLADLDKGDTVLFTFFFRDRAGRFYEYDDSAQHICSASRVPVFGLWEFNLGHGIVGGKLVSGFAQGQAAGKMVLRILAGEKAGTIPLLMESPNRFAFDFKILKQFGINESELPADSLIINRPRSFYDANKAVVWSGIMVIVSLTMLSLFLLGNIDKRRKMERDLQESRQSLKSITDNLPAVIYQFYATADNRYGLNYVSDKAFEIFELAPAPDTFFGDFSACLHEDDREPFLRSIADAAATVSPWDFKGRFVKTTGEIMWFSGNSIPHKQHDQIIFDGVLMDITEAKLTEEKLRRSERQMSQIINFLPDPTFVIDHQSRIIAWSRAMEELTGIKAEAILGKGDYEYATVFYNERRPIMIDLVGHWDDETANKYHDIRKKGEILISETKDSHRPFGDRHFKNTAGPLYDENGTVVGAIETIHDITERKQAEEELQQLRNYLSNIINSMPSVLVGVDTEGRVTQWNKQAERKTGMTFEKVRSQPLATVFPQLKDQMDRIKTAIRNRRVIRDPKIHRQNQGEIRFEDVTIFPLVANGVEGAVVRVDDVTDRVRLEEMMIQSEKMLSVGGLAAGMAHEINNPLAGILQNTAVLKNRLFGDLPANRKAAQAAGTTIPAILRYLELRKLQTMLDNIHTSGKRAAAIVKNMLSFARKSEHIISSHDLRSLLDQTIELARADYDMKKSYDFKHIDIVREYDDTIAPVPCEGSKIQQVFLNILKNGAEAMALVKDGRPQPMFILRVKAGASWVQVEIEDNGPGMDEITRRRIFEPFFTTKPVGEGTGLGLSVSYFIITENHGGKMTVNTTDRGGTRFVIRLPINGKQ